MHHESRNASLSMFLSARQKWQKLVKSWFSVIWDTSSQLLKKKAAGSWRRFSAHPRRETFSRNLKKIFLNSSTPRFLYYLCTCRQIGRTLAWAHWQCNCNPTFLLSSELAMKMQLTAVFKPSWIFIFMRLCFKKVSFALNQFSSETSSAVLTNITNHEC